MMVMMVMAMVGQLKLVAFLSDKPSACAFGNQQPQWCSSQSRILSDVQTWTSEQRCVNCIQ